MCLSIDNDRYFCKKIKTCTAFTVTGLLMSSKLYNNNYITTYIFIGQCNYNKNTKTEFFYLV